MAAPFDVVALPTVPPELTTLPTPLVTAMTGVPSGAGSLLSSRTLTVIVVVPFGATVVEAAVAVNVPGYAEVSWSAQVRVSALVAAVAVESVLLAVITTVAVPSLAQVALKSHTLLVLSYCVAGPA